MPREVLEFRIIVASPSDLFSSRKIVFDVIDEINASLDGQRITVRGLGWEEYVTPGVDSSAQALINRQLFIEYDIVVALFATRLGTPTGGSPSGTVAEIEQAISRTDSAMGHYRAQVYFCDKIESTSGISVDELKKVVDYRNHLATRGVLYSLYKDEAELARQVRMNLQRPIAKYLQTANRPLSSNVAVEVLTVVEATEAPARAAEPDELGLLDYQEKAENAIQIAGAAIYQMAVLIEEIGNETSQQAKAMENLASPSTSAKVKKDAINSFASFIESKAEELQQEATTARDRFSEFASAVLMAAAIEREDGDPDKYERGVTQLLAEAETMLLGLTTSRSGISSFKASVENLPRMTSHFNQAKRLLKRAIEECLNLFDQVEQSIFELTSKT